jgi:hypothetical protein
VAIYSQPEIDRLIACPKSIIEAPRRHPKLVGADFRNSMRLASSEVEGDFDVFMRQSEDFPENSQLA